MSTWWFCTVLFMLWQFNHPPSYPLVRFCQIKTKLQAY